MEKQIGYFTTEGGDRVISHVHNIKDMDKHFVINTTDHTITNDSGKLIIVQNDHNSERYTFEVPRYIEEHDMSESTRIEVHFSNFIRTKKEQNDDVFPVSDVWATRDKVYFSWLVSGNATKLVGSLTFSVTFNCHDDANKIIYTWSTGIYESISVVARHNNTETVVDTYPDLYEQMKQEIINSGGNGGSSSSSGIIDNVVDFDNTQGSNSEFDNTVEF